VIAIRELIDLVGTIGLGDEASKSKDILGRVYEYFLGRFGAAEGKSGGESYTPPCVVKLLVEMIEPYNGRVFDPCCGSGGMFVQSEKFVAEHGGRIGDISIWFTRITVFNVRKRQPFTVRWLTEDGSDSRPYRSFRAVR